MAKVSQQGKHIMISFPLADLEPNFYQDQNGSGVFILLDDKGAVELAQSIVQIVFKNINGKHSKFLVEQGPSGVTTEVWA